MDTTDVRALVVEVLSSVAPDGDLDTLDPAHRSPRSSTRSSTRSTAAPR